MPRRIAISIGILSIAIIAFQIVLMQILSIVQWYHFAYMIISVALLGFGAAGTFLSLFKKFLLKKIDFILPLLMVSSGLLMSMVVFISQIDEIRFDSYLLFSDYTHIWRLFITYLLFFLPFFLAALAVGIVFIKYVEQIGMLYFANLIGSGLGGIVALVLLFLFLPENLSTVVSLFPLISGIILISKRNYASVIFLSTIALIVGVVNFVNPNKLILSQYKSLSKTLNLPQAKIIYKQNSPLGLIEVVSSPALRFAPGLSLDYSGSIPITKAVFENGNWFGSIIFWQKDNPDFILNYTTNALPYFVQKREKVLVLNSGTGMNVAQAVTNNASEVTAVEQNDIVVSLMKKRFANDIDSVFNHKLVNTEISSSRTYLLMDTSKYDLIIFPTIESFGGSSGLYALQEQYDLTKEAIVNMLGKLTQDGVICITSWMDYPYRNPLKVLSTIVEALEEKNKNETRNYIASVRSWGTISFMVKNSPISFEESKKVREFCDSLFFDPVLLPDIKDSEREKYNSIQDKQFFIYLDKIISQSKNDDLQVQKEREEFYNEYEFNIKPATDNQPYFSQFLKWESLPHLYKIFGEQSVPFFEIGYLIVAITLIQILIAVLILIILPLFKIGWKGGNKIWVIFYFSGIGIGYMFVEIVLIQRFNLYFGNPIYSASAVISLMLIFSGIGSFLSQKIYAGRKTFLKLFSLIVIVLFIYAFILTPLLLATIAFSIILKILVTFFLIAPPAFIMGLPFPLGLRFLLNTSSASVKDGGNLLPWAWGINGCMSVVSTALATVASVEVGFIWVMIFAAISYGFPLIVNIKE